MSAGAVFKLIANDGKADRMIMATKLLNQRIKDVMCARRRAGKDDVTPTLVDLERTHILYVNAHFKPFAAIGYEYNKVRPQSGNPQLGGGVTFSIPQFGDFFHDMVCRVRLSAFSGVEGTTPVQDTNAVAGPGEKPGTAGGVTLIAASAAGLWPADLAEIGEDVTDGVITQAHQPQTNYNIVDAFGKVLLRGASAADDKTNTASSSFKYRNFVRYCEYPGNRLFRNVKFDVNGNPLDSYDEMIPTMLEKFCTPPGKRTGHDRLVGQEVPLTGYGSLTCATVTDADVTSMPGEFNTPLGISKGEQNQSNQTVGLFTKNEKFIGAVGAATTVVVPSNETILGQAALSKLNAVPASQFDVSRQLHQIVNGPQTPKPVQPPLEIWNKLRFWFNDDVRLSIASVSIPFGQRFITIDLNSANLLAYEFPSIYLEAVEITADMPQNGQVGTRKRYTPIFQKFGVEPISIEKMELYINNIFVNPEVHDIYIKRIGFSLIRVYRQHNQRCNSDHTDEKLLSQLKWPIEYMFVGLRPTWNIKDVTTATTGVKVSGNQNQWRDWHRLTRMVDATNDRAQLAYLSTDSNTTYSNTGQVTPDQYYLPVPTVDTMSLTAHGIVIFDGFCDTFYNQYLPFHYGGPALVTPDDPGALFINMALFPRSYQPSGHLNISRARETYLKWTTSYVSSKTPADLLAVAVAINFLLITDGSAVLRYST